MKRDDLARYHALRDFDATPEPRGAGAKRPRSGRAGGTGGASALRFVIQRHDASHLHFDFRLELDGVLKSWAVPKGPSVVLGEKRLAVEVEDHPLDYASFEGAIPEGHYGAGHVLTWDEGTWTPKGDPHEGLARGKLTFTLHGDKLRGGFALVRMGGRRGGGKKAGGSKPTRGHAAKAQWLLVKERDAQAVKPGSRAAAHDVTEPPKLPPLARFAPQLCTLVSAVPKGGGWVVEPKLDGYRALAQLEGGKARLVSRTGKPWTQRFGAIAEALAALPVRSAVLDGEVCALDDEGRPSFQRLQNALSAGEDARLVYYVFDLLALDGEDLRDRPLTVRKALLASVLGKADAPLAFVRAEDGAKAPALFRAACRTGLEGLVLKRADGLHRPRRTPEWVKVKCQRRQELVVVGYTAPKGARAGLGALLLAVHEKDGFRYVGKVGTGFTAQVLSALAKRLGALRVRTAPVTHAPRALARAATWVKPELVVEVTFTEWTSGGALRHPAFVGLREDKRPEEVVRERPKPVRARTTKHAKAKATTTTRKKTVVARDATVAGVHVSHADRVVDATSGLTKGELAAYFAAMAERMLPYVKGRPLALVRCPEGAEATCFFQKHRAPGMPTSIRGGKVSGQPVLYVDDVEGLVALAQFGTVEVHGWGSRRAAPLRPDWIVMDLDPDEGLPFRRVVEAARHVRRVLRRLGLTSFVKTTGGKGLHVVAPIAPERRFDDVKAFSKAVAEVLEAEQPDRYTTTLSKAARKGKIFVDYLRNGKGATAVLPYSPRARSGAPVAMPVRWEDLGSIDPTQLTVRRAAAWLARRKDPWAALLRTEQALATPPA